MKFIYLTIFALSTIVLSTSCSGTWEGVKSDTGKAWDSTKETIHEATE